MDAVNESLVNYLNSSPADPLRANLAAAVKSLAWAAWCVDYELGKGAAVVLMPGQVYYISAEIAKLAGRLASYRDLQEWICKPNQLPPIAAESAAGNVPGDSDKPSAEQEPPSNGVCHFSMQHRKGEA